MVTTYRSVTVGFYRDVTKVLQECYVEVPLQVCQKNTSINNQAHDILM
jgi:hypothetical protein